MAEAACNEVNILRRLSSHDNIVQLIQSKGYKSPLNPHHAAYYVLQFEMCSTSLRNFLFERSAKRVLTASRTELVSFMSQIGSALAFMHSARIVHNDIKPDNVMIANNRLAEPSQFVLKVIDFGLAHQYPAHVSLEDTKADKFCGTDKYMCPGKVVCDANIQFKRKLSASTYNPYLADVYAFGLTSVECAVGFRKPSGVLHPARPSALMLAYDEQGYLNFVPEHVKAIMHRMVDDEETNRPHVHEIVHALLLNVV